MDMEAKQKLKKELTELLGKCEAQGEVRLTQSEQMSAVFAIAMKMKNVSPEKVMEYAEIFALWQTIWENEGLRNLIIGEVSMMNPFNR